MAFVAKSVGTDSGFGKDLRELRELRKWSIEDLEQDTHIHRGILLALEEERFELITDPVYTEHHVRRIIQTLDGRVPFFLGKYRAALEAHRIKIGGRRRTFLERIRQTDLFVPTRYLPFLLLIPPLILLGGYVFLQILSLTASPDLFIEEPPDHYETDVSDVRLKGRTDPSATVTVNGLGVIVEPDGQFERVLDVPRGTTKLIIRSVRRYGGESEVIRYITYTP